MVLQPMASNVGGDYAPEPGLTQSFPVVTPLSDKRVGPQDVMTPADTWSSICNKELTDQQWAFNRERAQASLAKEQGLAMKLRQQAERAERDTEAAVSQAKAQIADVEHAVDERRRKAAESVRQMRMRLQEAQRLRDEAAQACQERLDEARLLLENERRHTADVEELLKRRRESSAAAWRQNHELEAQSEARLASCDKEVLACEEECKQRIVEIQKKVQNQIAHATARNQEDSQIARDRLAACDDSCRYRLEVEAQRNGDQVDAHQKRKTEAAARLEIDQFIMQRHLLNMKEDCAAHVQEVAKRQQETKLATEQKIKGITDVFGSVASRSLQFHEREQKSISSISQTVYTLGNHITARQQYNVCIDENLSACLQGHLHDMGGVATPSPRALPPPQN